MQRSRSGKEGTMFVQVALKKKKTGKSRLKIGADAGGTGD